MTTVRKYKVPAGVKCQIEGVNIRVTGPKGQLERNIRYPQLSVTCDENEVTISTESGRKGNIAMVGTIAAHVKNMCIGVTDGYEYHMKVVYSHFPIQLKLHGDTLEIANFLGEKKARNARIEKGVTAKVSTDEVILSGINKESVGTTAANIEIATKIKDRDPRVFQDGIYTTRKV
jgi:large subunit ribosomal protein L6